MSDSTATAVDQLAHAESHGSAPAINIVFPSDSAERLTDAIEKMGRMVMLTGMCAGAVSVLIVWGIIMLSKVQTANTLCAYEFNRFAAQAATGTPPDVLSRELKASGCNP